MITYAPAITPIENTPTAMEKTTSRVRALFSSRSRKTLRQRGCINSLCHCEEDALPDVAISYRLVEIATPKERSAGVVTPLVPLPRNDIHFSLFAFLFAASCSLNRSCTIFPSAPQDVDKTENAQSVGTVMTFGR